MVSGIDLAPVCLPKNRVTTYLKKKTDVPENKSCGKNIKKIINKLEGWVINTFSDLGIDGKRDQRMRGVWINNKKIVSIGLSFLKWVSRHGLSINYNTPRGRVELLEGCGLEAGITSSLNQMGHPINREDLEQNLIKNIKILNRSLDK